MTKIATKLFAGVGALLLTASLVGCKDDKDEPKYKESGPVTVESTFAFSRNLLDYADITLLYVDENGQLSRTKIEQSQCSSTSSKLSVSGCDLFVTTTKTISTISPDKVTSVGMMYHLTPKKENSSTATLYTGWQYAAYSKSNNIINDAIMSLTSPVLPGNMESELTTLTDYYNVTFNIDANADYSISDKYQWTVIAQLADSGDLSEEESTAISQILDSIMADFGSLRTSVLLAQALYNYEKEEMTTRVKSYLAGTSATSPVTISYRAVGSASYMGDFSQNIVIGK